MIKIPGNFRGFFLNFACALQVSTKPMEIHFHSVFTTVLFRIQQQ